MVRASTSLAALLTVTACQAQAFGRFGYTDIPQVPGIRIEESSFRTAATGSDSFRFLRPLPFRRTKTTAEVTHYSSGIFAGTPQSVRVNLRAPGFEMNCPFGLELKLSSLSAPLLTVAGATYGAETPTPPSRWVLVTFSDKQPPVLFVFLGADLPELVVQGHSGEWKLKTVGLYNGSVRVCLPFGLQPMSGNNVGTLGEMATKVQQQEALWTQPAPNLLSRTVEADEEGLTVTWTFDRKGALVPPASVLSKAGGYKLRTLSPVWDSGSGVEEGPQVFCQDKLLKLRFPMLRIPTGRSLAIGPASVLQKHQAPPLSIAETSDLAMANLFACRQQEVVNDSQRALEEYFSKSVFAAGPQSLSRLPYGADGRGMDLAAAHALLVQSLSMSQGEVATTNSLLTSLLWRMDPMTWKFWAPDVLVTRRAAAIVCVAASLDTEPMKRVDAAMLQAGLCADLALPTYCQKKGIPVPELSAVEPFATFRRALYQLDPKSPDADRYLASVSSAVRVVSEQSVTAVETARGTEVSWPFKKGDGKQLVLLVTNSTRVTKVSNLKSVTAKDLFGVVKVDFEPLGDGTCTVLLLRPKWAKALPKLVLAPRYSESN